MVRRSSAGRPFQKKKVSYVLDRLYVSIAFTENGPLPCSSRSGELAGKKYTHSHAFCQGVEKPK
jgi:hypothetical protein